MAFDLNKNDESAKETSNKKPGNSKFDLTKGEASGTTVSGNSSNSKNWIIAIVGIVIIGGGVWYYSTSSSNVSEPGRASQELAVKDTSSITTVGAQAKLGTGIAVLKPTAANQSVSSEPTRASPIPVEEETTSRSANVIVKQLNNGIPATFVQGSAAFSRIDQSLINRITSYLSKNPASSIQVNGYASSDGPIAINQAISQARADAFKSYLISKSISSRQITSIGKGIENPIASNDTESGRRKNRRVQVNFQ